MKLLVHGLVNTSPRKLSILVPVGDIVGPSMGLINAPPADDIKLGNTLNKKLASSVIRLG